jgi:type III secretion system needle length determinant
LKAFRNRLKSPSDKESKSSSHDLAGEEILHAGEKLPLLPVPTELGTPLRGPQESFFHKEMLPNKGKETTSMEAASGIQSPPSLSDLLGKLPALKPPPSPSSPTSETTGETHMPESKGKDEMSAFIPFPEKSPKISDSKDTRVSDREQPSTQRETPKPSHVSGMAVLESLQRTSNDQGVSVIESPKLSRIGTELVERILVSSAALDNKQEVRITFNQNLLADTTVRIFREGTALNVVFTAGAESSLQFLNHHQTHLKEHLTEKLFLNEVHVTVQQSASSDASGGDGRSRNRHEYFEADTETP